MSVPTYSSEIANSLPARIENGAITMSSREIADLCDKQHAHVMRDIRTMLDGLEIGQSKFGSTYADAQGKVRDCFELPKDLTLTLVAGYNVKLRKRIIDRWMELEDGRRALTPAEMIHRIGHRHRAPEP